MSALGFRERVSDRLRHRYAGLRERTTDEQLAAADLYPTYRRTVVGTLRVPPRFPTNDARADVTAGRSSRTPGGPDAHTL